MDGIITMRVFSATTREGEKSPLSVLLDAYLNQSELCFVGNDGLTIRAVVQGYARNLIPGLVTTDIEMRMELLLVDGEAT